MEKILDVKELRTNFYTDEGVVKAVDGLSYHINKGECVGLVGESGCGKSVSAMSILRLIPYPPGVIEGGEILFKGENLLEVSEKRNYKNLVKPILSQRVWTVLESMEPRV